MKSLVFETRNLKYWVLGPPGFASGGNYHLGNRSRRTLGLNYVLCHPKALRTHVLRRLGPNTIFYRDLGLFEP